MATTDLTLPARSPALHLAERPGTDLPVLMLLEWPGAGFWLFEDGDVIAFASAVITLDPRNTNLTLEV